MKKLLPLLTMALVLGTLVAPAAGAPEWRIDPAHTNIMFSVTHIYIPIHGFFEQANGTIRFDPADLGSSMIDVEIRVDSINTLVEQRNRHLLSDDFFSADKFPVIKFTSSEIVHRAGNEYAAKGKFTMRDVTRDIELPFTFLGMKQDPMDAKRVVAGFEAHHKLDRLEYGVGNGKFYRMGVVGKDVAISIFLELQRAR